MVGELQHARLIEKMAAVVLAETQSLREKEVRTLCKQLFEAFLEGINQRDNNRFQKSLVELLQQATAGGDDATLWQAAISVLRAELPNLRDTWSSLAVEDVARELLNDSRITIGAVMRQQHRHYVVDQQWTSDRLGHLTARLLNTLDETEIYATLAQGLPELGIDMAWVALDGPRGRRPDCMESSPLRDCPGHRKDLPAKSFLSASGVDTRG